MPKQILAYDGLQRCPYLPGRVARLPLYRQLGPLDLDETDARLAAGERRVGWSLYRTSCPTCQECRPLRVLCDEFTLSKSHRRVLKRWQEHGRVEIGRPTCTPEMLDLYNRHKRERGLVHDDDEPMDEVGYLGWLADSCMPTIEMRYYYDDALVGVGILDVGRTSASSVYFYFDPSPETSKLSPGVFSTLQEIAFCRRTGRKFLYLGLYVQDCSHLSYKADWKPHERLLDGDWRRFG